MADIFTEVEEELRQDRAKALWKKYGSLAITAAVVVVGAVAGWTWWQGQQAAQAVAAADGYAIALTQIDDDPAAARQAFLDVAQTDHPSYRAMARMLAARMAEEEEAFEDAAAGFAIVADDADAPAMLRETAALGAARVEIALGRTDAARARLTPLAAQGSPWRAVAMELQAAADLAEGDVAAAAATLQTAADDLQADAQARARAARFLEALE